MNKIWRWIDNEDGTHTLLEGELLRPLARVVLMCGGIDAADQDMIDAVPQLIAACEDVEEWIEQDTFRDLDELSDDCKALLATVKAALAKARGEVPDAE